MSKKNTPPKPSRWRYVLITGSKVSLVLLVLLGGYLIYLDSTLTERFRSSRYEAPALVYGRALVLTPGAALTMAAVERELTLLQYQRVAQVVDSGQYSVSGPTITLYRRPFDFVDGPVMAQHLRLEFQGSRLQRLISLPDQRPLTALRLEPPYLGRLAGGNQENRLLVGLELVPDLLVETLLLVEDRDFYHHGGISLTSIGRAALANLAAMRTVQGGSTLTQQLVKNLYLTREKTLWRKANEALMAVILDYRFSKNEILETYFNEVYFGQDGGSAIHGIGLASQFYFAKQVQQLEAAEIALLVAIIKGPSYYNPRRYPEHAQQRRDWVLQLMVAENLLSQRDYQQALAQPLVEQQRSRLTQQPAAHYLELVQQELNALTLPANWSQQGLRVFTYLDPWAQQLAQQALASQLPLVSKDTQLQGAVVIADHQQAGIRAVVGDRDGQRVGFNRARDALRPIGSLLKPMIYAAALEPSGGYDLASFLDDSPVSISSPNQPDWQPQNYDSEYRGMLMLYDALVQSRNIPAVRLGLDIGLPTLVEKLQQAGVSSPIAAVPALTLGAVEVSPLMMTEVYAMLAQLGQHRPLATVAAVTNHQGLPLYQRKLTTPTQVFSNEASYLVNHGLQGVITMGTGRKLGERFAGHQLAGKSGTTNDYRDSWFIGYDGQHVVTVWLGRDDNQPIGLTGSSGALPVVSEVFAGLSVQPFEQLLPSGLSMAAFHRQTGARVPLNCDQALRFPARPQRLPENLGCDGQIEDKSWWQRWF